jgi:hypothetical protein
MPAARCAAMRALVLLFASLTTFSLFAQSPRHTAYAEIGGNGIGLTANYEYRLSRQLAGRLGFSVVTSENSAGKNETVVLLPLMLNFLTRPESNHHLELGGGILLALGDELDLFWEDEIDEDFSRLVGTATIGYRYQKPGRGFVFRAGFTPLFDSSGIAPWAGVSFGYGW